MVNGINNSNGTLQNNLNEVQKKQNTVLANISAGIKTNLAEKSASDLAKAITISTQIAGLNQSQRNVSDAISVTQVAESALGEQVNLLQRARELAVQAANGSQSNKSRQAIQTELNQIQQQLSSQSQVEFNGIDLFQQGATLTFQVGNEANDTITVDLASSQASNVTINISTQANAQASITAIDQAIEQITTTRAEIGGVQNRLDASLQNLANTQVAEQEALSRIQDSDIAAETAELAKQQVLANVGIAMVAQANANQSTVLNLLSPK